MGKVVDLAQRRPAPEECAEQGKEKAKVFEFHDKKLVFQPKSIPLADRNRICHFCPERAARWFEVYQNNFRVFFDVTIYFCLNPRCATRARIELTRMAPSSNLPTLLRIIKKLPALVTAVRDFFKKGEPPT